MSERDYLLETPCMDPIVYLPSIRQIQAEICEKYKVTLAELISAQRSQRLCVPRFEAFYRASKECGLSLPQIGRHFGGRDHTTVLHGIRRHEQRVGGEG